MKAPPEMLESGSSSGVSVGTVVGSDARSFGARGGFDPHQHRLRGSGFGNRVRSTEGVIRATTRFPYGTCRRPSCHCIALFGDLPGKSRPIRFDGEITVMERCMNRPFTQAPIQPLTACTPVQVRPGAGHIFPGTRKNPPATGRVSVPDQSVSSAVPRTSAGRRSPG